MLSCQQVTELVSASQERPLNFKEKVKLRMHTVMCSACRNFESSMGTLRKAMQEFAKGEHNTTDKKD
ncbi:MAG: hypothetical protein COA99_11745 [Moraxellaceae bacterium]|nr:MAG: hypothetical protein COA99_11745 [Moraxellaceae bacterium]